jgi:speckle-type POZ protein
MAYCLLSAADKYGLDRLKLICEETVCSSISVETSCHTFVLADLYNAYNLKAEAVNFIASHAVEVTETVGWKDMLKYYPSLVSELFRAVANKQDTSIGPPRKSRKLN